ncbi:MAG: hypothetical protein H7Y60_16060 [Rhodospirillaceae bacterium]|nr:hypothetical protein [Rhodospirillales bacterium]
MMIKATKLTECGKELERAFALLNRANEVALPTVAQLITKRCLLDEARHAVDAARDALVH